MRAHSAGKLLRLAHRHEAGAERVSERRREDEAARLDAQHHIHIGARVVCLQGVDGAA